MTEESKEAAPQKDEDRRNQFLVNDQSRCMQVLIFDSGEDSMAKALGAIEMAKDMVKGKFTEWRMQDAKKKTLLVPNGNGKPLWRMPWKK